MKYKAGDKVIIKTWDIMKKEYGTDYLDRITSPGYNFTPKMEETINKIFPDRILTIRKCIEEIDVGYYCMEAAAARWTDWMIEYSLAEKEDRESWIPINNRFEIMDLD